MKIDLSPIKLGLAFVIISLLIGIIMGIAFGVNEDFFKDFISSGIANNPDVHDSNSAKKIWRYAQRVHFHATGIASFSLGLLILALFSKLKKPLIKLSSFCIGLGSFYPLAWLSMFILAPSIGRGAAHDHFLTQSITYVSIAGLLLGLFILLSNLFFRLFSEKS